MSTGQRSALEAEAIVVYELTRLERHGLRNRSKSYFSGF